MVIDHEEIKGAIPQKSMIPPFTSAMNPPRHEVQQVGSSDEAYHRRASEDSDVSKNGTNPLLAGPLLRREIPQHHTDERNAASEHHEENDDASNKASVLTAACSPATVTATQMRLGAASATTTTGTTLQRSSKHRNPQIQIQTLMIREKEIWGGGGGGEPHLLTGGLGTLKQAAQQNRRRERRERPHGQNGGHGDLHETMVTAAAGESSPQAQREKTAAFTYIAVT